MYEVEFSGAICREFRAVWLAYRLHFTLGQDFALMLQGRTCLLGLRAGLCKWSFRAGFVTSLRAGLVTPFAAGLVTPFRGQTWLGAVYPIITKTLKNVR